MSLQETFINGNPTTQSVQLSEIFKKILFYLILLLHEKETDNEMSLGKKKFQEMSEGQNTFSSTLSFFSISFCSSV